MISKMQRFLAFRCRIHASACVQSAQAVRRYATNAEPCEENHIKSWRDGQHLGRIHIDRPKALNAMSAGEHTIHKQASQAEAFLPCLILTQRTSTVRLAALLENCLLSCRHGASTAQRLDSLQCG